MTRQLLKILLLIFVAASSATAQVPAKQCALLGKEPVKANKLLPVVNLTESQLESIRMTRACLKGYAYPGGEEALLKASSSEIRDDVVHLKELFDKRSELKISTLPENDKLRVVKMELGWNREQVLLWGNWAYMRQLDSEEKFEAVLKEAERIRGEFGLNVVPLKHWDAADQNTYFSPQTLRNMIAAFEYSAKGHLTAESGPERTALVKAYLVDQPALAPTMTFTGNPGDSVLAPVCSTQAKISGQ
jgi:hypothetical protein